MARFLVFYLLYSTGHLAAQSRLEKIGPNLGPADYLATNLFLGQRENNDKTFGLQSSYGHHVIIWPGSVAKHTVDFVPGQKGALGTANDSIRHLPWLSWWAYLCSVFLATFAILAMLGLRRKHEAVAQSEARLKEALWGSGDELWNWDLESDVIHRIQPSIIFCKDTSWQADHCELAFTSIFPDDVEIIKAAIDDHLRGKTEFFEAQYRLADKDGGWRWVIDRGRIVARAPDGSPLRMAGTIKDVHLARESEDKLRMIAKSFENASNGVVVTDLEFRIRATNPAYTEITGFSAEEALGASFWFLEPPGSQDQTQLVKSALDAKGRWQGEIWQCHKSGRRFPISAYWDAVYDNDGRRTHYINVFSDITYRKKAELRLHQLANFDQLTGLANRALFKDRLAHALSLSERGGRKLALFFLDLDNFKIVNDSLGHAAGDLLLRVVAQRMKATLRKVDSLARPGGDEFTIILENLTDLEDVITTADRVIHSFLQPFKLAHDTILVTISMGISVYPDDGEGSETLIKHADTAMYHAKKEGRRNYKFFAPEMNTKVVERLTITTKLRDALFHRDFVLHYQPKYELNRGTISGFEALVRWQPPGENLIPPLKFIPVAEDTGLIIPLGEFVLREACRQTVAWLKEGFAVGRVAVNLSAHQFSQPDLVDLVKGILEETRLAPRFLELEITESALMQDMSHTIETLEKFQRMGIALALDDFGTGYSSLSYLKRFPIDSLKIDQSFVRDLDENSEDAGIVAAILDMAHNLGLIVIAEGVETETQLRFLKAHGCEEVQGYLFSRPVPSQEIPALFGRGPIM